MSALLVYSTKCKHSMDCIQFIYSNAQLKQIVQLHDVNLKGVPQQYARYITRVPTLLTKNGKILVGNEIKTWLNSLLPNTIDNCQLGQCSIATSSFDGGDDGGGIFELDNYGQSLQPAMTPELQAKINQKVAGGQYSMN